MRSKGIYPGLALVWIAVLISPSAWALSLASMFWLTSPVCQGRSHAWLMLTGALCLAGTLVGGIVAVLALRSSPARSIDDSQDVTVFLLRMALGFAVVFALVIGLSLVPVGHLTPCPL